MFSRTFGKTNFKGGGAAGIAGLAATVGLQSDGKCGRIDGPMVGRDSPRNSMSARRSFDRARELAGAAV